MASTAPKPRLAVIGAVALGGVLGAAARVGLPWPRLDPHLGLLDPIPLVIINLTGALLLGLTAGYLKHRDWSEAAVKGLTTGFLGSFTTMSALTVSYVGLASMAHDSLLPLLSLTVGLIVFLGITTWCTRLAHRLGDYLGRQRS